jgi:hypothetical protein
VEHTYEIDLETTDQPQSLRILHAVLSNWDSLRPAVTPAVVTEQSAECFGRLALNLSDAGVAPECAAHFLVQLLFCLFAQDVGLLPGRVLSDVIDYTVEAR